MIILSAHLSKKAKLKMISASTKFLATKPSQEKYLMPNFLWIGKILYDLVFRF